jgi:hypothetical protein
VHTLAVLTPLTISLAALVLLVVVVLLLGLRRPAPGGRSDTDRPRPDPEEPRTPLWAHPLFWLGAAVLFVAISIIVSRYVPGVVLLLPLLFLRRMRWRRPPGRRGDE